MISFIFFLHAFRVTMIFAKFQAIIININEVRLGPHSYILALTAAIWRNAHCLSDLEQIMWYYFKNQFSHIHWDYSLISIFWLGKNQNQ